MKAKFSFAHLLGGRSARAEEQAPEDQQDAGTEGDEEAADDQPEDQPAAAEGEDDPEGGETGDGTGDGDEPDEAARAYARGRADERARCAQIFASHEAAGNIAAACEIAFNTNLSAKRAVAVLSVAGGASGVSRGLSAAMAAFDFPQVGSGGQAANQPQGGKKANPLVAAHAKATGLRPRNPA